MLAYTYTSHGKFELINKPKPELQGPRDAIVRITLGSICTSDLHIKQGSVPRAELTSLELHCLLYRACANRNYRTPELRTDIERAY